MLRHFFGNFFFCWIFKLGNIFENFDQIGKKKKKKKKKKTFGQKITLPFLVRILPDLVRILPDLKFWKKKLFLELS